MIQVRRQTVSGQIALTIGALLMVALVAMPWWASSGLIRTIVELSCFIAIAQMWNLLAGYAGLVSVGQQAFSGAAAYAMFVLAINFGVNPFLSAALCLIVPAILAVPTYALLHRLDGPYFSIGTWVVAEVFRLVTSNLQFVNAGGGLSLRVMGDYSSHQREVGITIMCAIMLLATIGGSYALLRSRQTPAVPDLCRHCRGYGAGGRDLFHGAIAHHAAIGVRSEMGVNRDLYRHGRRYWQYRRRPDRRCDLFLCRPLLWRIWRGVSGGFGRADPAGGAVCKDRSLGPDLQAV
jgi:hypothetical protein